MQAFAPTPELISDPASSRDAGRVPTAPHELASFPFPEAEPGGDPLVFDRIIPSPINNNAFWLTKQEGIAYEFDPTRGSWVDLQGVLDQFAIGLKGGDSIAKDPFDPDFVWIGNDRHGLIRYSISSADKQIFPAETSWPGQRLTVLCLEPERVWFGTTGGLFYYHRKEKALRREDRLMSVGIRSLDKEDGRMWINGESIYDLSSGAIESVYDLAQHPRFKIKFFHLVEGYKVFKGDDPEGYAVIMNPMNEIVDSIRGASMDLVFMDSARHLWFCGPHCDRWKINAKALARVPYEISGVRRIVESDEHLYFAGSRFLRLNKAGTALDACPEPAVDFIADAKHLWVVSKGCLLRMPREGCNTLFHPYLDMSAPGPVGEQALGGTFIDLLKRAASLFREHPPADPHAVVTDEEDRIIHAINETDFVDMDRLEEFAATTKDSWERQFAYYGLITKPVASGNLSLAMNYLRKLREEFPETTLWRAFAPEDIPLMDKTWREVQEIQAMSVSEDERLWRLGGVLFEGFRLSFNVSVVYYIVDYPLGLWDKLVNEYPNSQWADDAEYELLSYRNTVDDDGSVDLNDIEVWAGFIRKHPDSVHVADAKFAMVGIYQSYCEFGDGTDHWPSSEEAVQQFRKAHAICSEILQQYPGTPHEENARNCIAEIDREIERRSLRLIIHPASNVYSLGEPVLVRIELTNTSSTSKMIKVRSELPNFGMGLKFSDAKGSIMLHSEHQNHDAIFKEVVLSPDGGSYQEIQDIRRMSLSPHHINSLKGYFEIGQVGRYLIQADYRDIRSQTNIVSEEIELIIREN